MNQFTVLFDLFSDDESMNKKIRDSRLHDINMSLILHCTLHSDPATERMIQWNGMNMADY